MKATKAIIEMINIWNQVSGYTYTYELICSTLYIKNSVTTGAITKLYEMISPMIRDCLCYIKVDPGNEVMLEVRDV